MTDNDGPISWMTLEKGAPILSSDGERLGAVGEVVADRQKDIFSGVTLAAGLFKTDRFIPAEMVESMSAEGVRLTVSSQEAESLEEYGA